MNYDALWKTLKVMEKYDFLDLYLTHYTYGFKNMGKENSKFKNIYVLSREDIIKAK